MSRIGLGTLLLAVLAMTGCGLQNVPGWLGSKAVRAGRAVTGSEPVKPDEPAAAKLADDQQSTPPRTDLADADPAVPDAASEVLPPASPAAPSSGTPTNFAGLSNKLRYGFKNGSTYSYRVQIEAEMPDDSMQVYDGTCHYHVKVDKARPARQGEMAHKPTATAFVVSPDGYLVTCHHVVEGAGRLDIALGGKVYTARVIERDEPNDLAILKIDARGLTTVPLCNSDNIQVGEEVRAIGFPLSSILGDSLKATRGTISGIETKNGRRLFQVDASINPGNSGGPLVNENGEVVGVTSAKLTGSVISNVGFVVPANYARTLLDKHQVRLAARRNVSRLTGPELVRTVSRAVALVTVSTGGNSPASSELYTMRVTGTLMSHQRNVRPSRIGGPPRIGFPRGPSRISGRLGFPGKERDEIQIDAAGNILKMSGGQSLPFMLGNLSQLVIEPLGDGETNWEWERQCVIQEKKADDDPFGRGFVRPPSFGRLGFGDEEEVTRHAASERSEYSLGDPEDGKVTIHKEYELSTDAEEGAEPYLRLVGEGDITFDLEHRIPVEMKYEGTVTVNKNKVSVRIPLKVTYKQIVGQQTPATPAAEADAKLDVAGQPVTPAVTPQARPEPPQPKELTADELAKLLLSLESKNGFERKGALDKLAAALPTEERRAEIAKTIEPYIDHEDGFTRYSALKALAKWGSADNVPAIIEQVNSHDVFTRNHAMEALGKLKDPRAVEPLCEKFKNFQDRHHAGEALLQLGPMAEPGLAKLLTEVDDWNCKMRACQLLAKIGSKQSLPALEQATKDKNGLVSSSARSAIDAINKRD